MPRKRKLLNLSERCRLCLTENGEMSDLFKEPHSLKLKDLSDCTSIEIKSEQNLPKNVCHACVYKLEMWNEFKERFVRSNRLLLTRLEVTESVENAAIKAKRKYVVLQETSDENNLSDSKKKLKSDESPAQCKNFVFVDLKTEEKSLSPVLKSSSRKKIDPTKSTNSEKGIKNDLKKLPVLPKFRQSARRGRTTERRKAYTRRWVARKRALIAATGNNSETDSGASDNQLSPVQKARAKSNADKEDEKQKKIARALKNLETNMNDFKRGSDSDARRTLRSRNMKTERKKEQNQKSAVKIKEKEKSKAKEKKEKETEKENVSIQPQTVKSELRIGDATYIVTSTLVISEPEYLNKSSSDLISSTTKNENTDIIDAVQLKRINPISNVSADKRLLERCLNIEVEGTELEALQRVQVDLASFVEKDMKDKLFSENGVLEDIKGKAKDSYDTLDQQLKNIVVKAIKKNYETSVQKKDLEIEEDVGKSKTVSPEFVKAAMHSPVFQPALILTRLDISNVPYQITNIDVLQRPKTPENVRERTTSIEYLGEQTVTDKSKDSKVESLKRINPGQTYKKQVESVECDTTTHKDIQNKDNLSNSLYKNSGNLKNKQIIRNSAHLEEQIKSAVKHRCGVCGRLFAERKEAEEHLKEHKAVPQKARQKLMRCKRCHEIVAARYVKLHVCSLVYKNQTGEMNYISEQHKCTVCDKVFISETTLVDHLSTHEDQKLSMKCNICEIDFDSEQALVKHLQTHDKLDFEKPFRFKNKKQERDEKTTLNERTTVESHKIIPQKKHEGYTCFVCDKKFNDEEVMKDHLQQHCDDISEDERSSKENYQCAICGDSLETEDAFKTHVENHLFDDEDDNPNLISITENGKPKEVKYYCEQCAEEFPTKAAFVIHKEAHEEDLSIAEWEGQKNLMHDHSCTICDEVFLNEQDLAEHLDVHNGNVHVCLLCEKSFPTLSDLQVHVESH